MKAEVTLLWFLTTSISLTSCDRLLLILANGFAGHYLQRYEHLPGFNKIIKEGAYSRHLVPEFPTLSLPNQYSIVTGLHPSNHGIVSNYMYDTVHGQYFKMGSRDSDYTKAWWQQNDVEPVWVTSSRQNFATGLYYWIGCQDPNDIWDAKPRVCLPHYPASASNTLGETNVDKIIPALASLNFTLVYHNSIDIEGHSLGIHKLHAQPDNSIVRLSRIVDRFLRAADAVGDLNVLIVSDHGMTNLPKENMRYLEDYANMNLIRETVESGAIKMIRTKRYQENQLYRDLTSPGSAIPNVRAFYSEPGRYGSIDPRYNYHNGSRVPEIVLIADPGYGIFTRRQDKQFPAPTIWDWALGMHGYDNEHPDMHGVIMGYGPAFKRGYEKDVTRLVDVYSLICHILSLECKQNDGRLDRIIDMTVNGANRHEGLLTVMTAFYMLTKTLL